MAQQCTELRKNRAFPIFSVFSFPNLVYNSPTLYSWVQLFLLQLTTRSVIQDPEVCKLMYPYVPDNMRSPEGVQLMMSDPEIRDKLENALQQAFKVVLPSPLLYCSHCCMAATGHRPDSCNLACVPWQARFMVNISH